MSEAAAQDESAEDGPARSVGGAIWEQVSTLLLAVAIALGIRAFVIEPYRIPSGSMFPTLLIGDHLFVNKFVYGIKIPFTDLRLPGFRDPERGEVVVFTVAKRGAQTFPADRAPELPSEEFVKRIVAIPGDRVEVRDGVLFVNGEEATGRPLPDDFTDDAGRRLAQVEVQLDDRRFLTLDDPGMRSKDLAPRVVEEDRYFMLGDNRDHSKDSRYWGTVRLAEIKGPAFVLYWSWDFNGSWGDLLNPLLLWDLFTSKMRWERIGDGVP